MGELIRAFSVGLSPGAAFVFGVLTGHERSWWHWIWAVLGVLTVLYIGLLLLQLVHVVNDPLGRRQQ